MRWVKRGGWINEGEGAKSVSYRSKLLTKVVSLN